MNAIVEFLNVWGARFAGFALPMFLQSAVLILLLFALDLAFRKRVRATIRYAVWMLALVKLALPPSLSSPTGAAYWLSSETIGSYSAPTSAILPVANEATIPFEFMKVGSVRGNGVTETIRDTDNAGQTIKRGVFTSNIILEGNLQILLGGSEIHNAVAIIQSFSA